jgi:hypothetical protein
MLGKAVCVMEDMVDFESILVFILISESFLSNHIIRVANAAVIFYISSMLLGCGLLPSLLGSPHLVPQYFFILRCQSMSISPEKLANTRW